MSHDPPRPASARTFTFGLGTIGRPGHDDPFDVERAAARGMAFEAVDRLAMEDLLKAR